jgi:predicted Fe-Mo cluster-binding NifX family protein
MKIAVSVSGDKIAATFDFAEKIVVFECNGKAVVNKQRFIMEDALVLLRALKLKELNIGTLICGAISNSATNILRYYDIIVIAGITGNTDLVVDEFLWGNENFSKYKLPAFIGEYLIQRK